MRAVVITDTSNRSVSIADVPDPVPGDDEILVDVKACGVNFTDLLSLDGKYQNNPPPPFTPGKDAAGIVEAVGANVTSHKVGDRVIAHVIHGAMAEKAVCPAALAFTLPDGVEYDAAAAMGLAYLTGYLALTRRGRIQPGEVVQINGASGGVGLASVSLAKALGAKTVLAGLTTPSKADAVLAAGADAIIDLTVDFARDCERGPGGGVGLHIGYHPGGEDQLSAAEKHFGRRIDDQLLHQAGIAPDRRGAGGFVRPAAGGQDRSQHHEPAAVRSIHGRHQDAGRTQDRRQIRADYEVRGVSLRAKSR
jgi:NADPH2:quinone reductase